MPVLNFSSRAEWPFWAEVCLVESSNFHFGDNLTETNWRVFWAGGQVENSLGNHFRFILRDVYVHVITCGGNPDFIILFPGLPNSCLLAVVVGVEQGSQGVSECGFGGMSGECSAVDLKIDISWFDEISIISAGDLVAVVGQPAFPDWIWPSFVLKLSHFEEEDCVFLQRKFDKETIDISGVLREVWVLSCGEFKHLQDVARNYLEEAIIYELH